MKVRLSKFVVLCVSHHITVLFGDRTSDARSIDNTKCVPSVNMYTGRVKEVKKQTEGRSDGESDLRREIKE